MMGSERVVGARTGDATQEVSGIVPQSLVELFRLLDERTEASSGGDEDETETWNVRVGYLQVCTYFMYAIHAHGESCPAVDSASSAFFSAVGVCAK